MKKLLSALVAVTALAPLSLVLAGEEGLKPGLIGTWGKQRTQEEDHDLPGDKDWTLRVTFSDDGRFTWKAVRKEPDGKSVDESVAGTWQIRGRMITYAFDPPSNAALKRLPQFFAYWPNERIGQQKVYPLNGNIVLAYQGGKVRVELKKITGAEERRP